MMQKNVNNPKVSVVIPVYNTENYLKECMDSVISQTLKDIEVICVDDGSTDNSGNILDEYAMKDDRIRIIHKKNSGYGHTVNVGMEESHGEYISIVEPDDYIKADMLLELYIIASQNCLDWISSNHERFFGSKKKYYADEYKIINNINLYNVVLYPKIHREIFRGNFINPAGLFKRNFLKKNDIRHNETPGASYQDLGFCFQVLVHAKRMMIVDKSFYCYRQDNPNSSIANKGKMMCVINEYIFIYQMISKDKDIYSWVLPEFQRRRFGSYLYTFERLSDEFKVEFLHIICKEFNNSKINGELYLESFSPLWKRKMEMIMKEPEEYYNRFYLVGQQLHNLVCGYKKVVIYGAGKIGKRLYDLLWNEDKERIAGFAVTVKDNNPSIYKGILVREIENYKLLNKDILIVIGVSSKYKKEIEDILFRLGFKNVKYFEFGDEDIVL